MHVLWTPSDPRQEHVILSIIVKSRSSVAIYAAKLALKVINVQLRVKKLADSPVYMQSARIIVRVPVHHVKKPAHGEHTLLMHVNA